MRQQESPRQPHWKPRFYHPDYNFLRPHYWFGQVDSRPLGVFRILLTLILLKVAVFGLFSAELFFSDAGAIPSTFVMGLGDGSPRFSLLFVFTQPWQVYIFLVVWIGVLLALLVGYHTRWMLVLNFIFLLSLVERSPMVGNGGDSVLVVLSFWSMFAPLGDHYALDAVRQRRRRYQRSGHLDDLRVEATPRTAFALPVRMLQWHFALIYLLSVVAKSLGEQWHSGEALYYALQLRTYTHVTGDWVLHNVPLPVLQAGTYFTLIVEAAFIVLVFLPFFQPLLRVIGLLLGAILHTGIGLLMAIRNFSLVMMIAYVPYLHPEWIVALDRRLRAPRRRLRIAPPVPGQPQLTLLAITNPDEIAVDPSLPPQIVADCDGWAISDDASSTEYRGWDAWREITGHMPLSRFWRWTLRWRPLRRVLWVLAARLTVRRVDPAADTPAVESRWQVAYHAALVLLLPLLTIPIVWWGLDGADHPDGLPETMPDGILKDGVQYLGLSIVWTMFAPNPLSQDLWIKIPGTFEDGSEINLLTGGTPSNAMRRVSFGPDRRWSNFAYFTWIEKPPEMFEALSAYYCRQYNEVQGRQPGQRLQTVDIVFNYYWQTPPGERRLPMSSVHVWRQACNLPDAPL